MSAPWATYRRAWQHLCAVSCVVALASCTRATKAAPSENAPEGVPPQPTAQTTPPAQQPSASATTGSTTTGASANTATGASPTGKQLYARYCALCHAAAGTGYAADHAPSLVSPTFLASASDDFIAQGIRLGRPNTAMAAYGQSRGGPLDDSQIAAIIEFLRTDGPPAVALPGVQATGDATQGATLFKQRCQSCHGSSTKRGTAPYLHNPEFLAAASPAFLRYAIQHGRPPTKMPAFEKKLKAGQIDALVAWLGTLPSAKARAAQPVPAPSVPDNLPLVINPRGAAPDFSLREGRFIAAEQLKRALEKKKKIIIIDARAPSDWIQFHIPGAIVIPYYDTPKLEAIPNDGTWIVAYCACPHHASGEVVDALRKRGHPHTAVLDEGILFWRDQGYPIAGEAVAPDGAAPKRGGPRQPAPAESQTR